MKTGIDALAVLYKEIEVSICHVCVFETDHGKVLKTLLKEEKGYEKAQCAERVWHHLDFVIFETF